MNIQLRVDTTALSKGIAKLKHNLDLYKAKVEAREAAHPNAKQRAHRKARREFFAPLWNNYRDEASQ